MPSCRINFYSQAIKSPLRNKKELKKCLNFLLGEEKKIFLSGKVSVIFCSDQYLLELNKKFLNHDTLTDVITFNYSEANDLQGELYISIDRVKDNSDKFSQIFEIELSRVIIHGFLHLCGYNDTKKSERVVMTKKEDRYLDVLKENYYFK
jgi:probable rRNA maturation factor